MVAGFYAMLKRTNLPAKIAEGNSRLAILRLTDSHFDFHYSSEPRTLERYAKVFVQL